MRTTSAILLWLLLAGCGVPNEMVDADRRASEAERAAVAALGPLDEAVSPAELPDMRAAFEGALGTARAERARLAELLSAELDGRLLGRERLTRLRELNDDLLRCHETLEERAEAAFAYVADGRASRGFRHDVWGLVDPRTCFEELAPAKEELLR